MNCILTEPHYFPNIQYFSLLTSADTLILDDLSVFKKQSFRNRAQVLTANKVMDLIVPVKKGKTKLPVKEVLIDYSTKWQREQWHCIQSAYGKSPFFEFYADYFRVFFESKTKYLIDHDVKIIEVINELLALEVEMVCLSTWSSGLVPADYRNKFSPKTPYSSMPEYYQVFSNKFGFVPNLSVLDLLFNMGNEAPAYLEKAGSVH